MSKKSTTEEFIKKAKDVHGDVYDYDNVEYVGNATKVKITCRIHGVFEQTPNSHLVGHACPKCYADKVRLLKSSTTEVFIEKARIVHSNRYDYSLVEYVNNSVHVKIICPEHGVFLQTPNGHLSGAGCKKCANYELKKQQSSDTDEFISKAQSRHLHETYNYSHVRYISAREKVEILCKEHGPFWQTPNIHLRGGGCPRCAKSGFKVDQPAFVYLLSDGDILKVGITNNKVSKRLRKINHGRINKFKEIFHKHVSGHVALITEGKLLKWLRDELSSLDTKFDGYTECFHIGHITFPQIIDKIVELTEESNNDNK